MPLSKEKVIQEIADWIDTEVLAEAICEAIEDQAITPTVRRAKAVYLNFMETELDEGLDSAAQAEVENGFTATD